MTASNEPSMCKPEVGKDQADSEVTKEAKIP